MNQALDITGLSRRRLLATAFAAAALGLLAACGPSAPAASPTVGNASPPTPAPPPPPATPAPAPAVQAQPTSAPAASSTPRAKVGGNLRIGQIGDLGTLDGHFYSIPQFYTLYTAYDRLTRYDADQNPQPMLAQSWELSPDAKQIKLNLRHGVHFHSGREFTSDDVKWNIMRARDPKVGVQQFANQAGWFSGIDTPDKYTVVLSSDQPRPALFDFFELFNMLDSQSMEKPDAASRIVGTGPFMLAEYAQGDHISFKKNADYWDSNRPLLDSFRVDFVQDAQTMSGQLEAGALDLVVSPTARDAVRLQSDSHYQVLINRETGAVSTLAANTTKAPTDNKLVRQALNYALNRRRFADTVLLGIGDPRSLPWRASSPAYESSKENFYTFDLDKAKSLIEQSGLSDVQLDFVYNGNITATASLAQIYKADLATIGVTLNLAQVDNASFLEQVNQLSYRGVIGLAAFQSGFEPATGFISSKNFNPGSNAAGFKDDRYTQLVNAANVEPDLNKRKALYSQINDILLDESFLMLVTTNPQVVVARGGVNGVFFDFHDGLVPADMWLS